MADRLRLDDLAAEPPPDLVARVASVLRGGGLVAAPSDTVYGFLAGVRVGAAVEALRKLKGREGNFIALVGSWDDAGEILAAVDPAVRSALERVWPGPVTAIVRRPGGVTWSDAPTLAVRMPALPFLGAVLRASGMPLFSTSANRPGQPTLPDGDAVWREFSGEIALLVDAGPAAATRPSTIVDLTGAEPRVVRPGGGDVAPLLDRSPGRL